MLRSAHLYASQFASDVFDVLERALTAAELEHVRRVLERARLDAREVELVVDERSAELVSGLPGWCRSLPVVEVAARIAVRACWQVGTAQQSRPAIAETLAGVVAAVALVVAWLVAAGGLVGCEGEDFRFTGAQLVPVTSASSGGGQGGHGGAGGAGGASTSSGGGHGGEDGQGGHGGALDASASSGGGQGGQGGEEPCGGPCPAYQECVQDGVCLGCGNYSANYPQDGACYGCVPDDPQDEDAQACDPGALPSSLYCPYTPTGSYFPKYANGAVLNCVVGAPVAGKPGWSHYCCAPVEAP